MRFGKLWKRFGTLAVCALGLVLVVVSCKGDDSNVLTVYSGRNQHLVGPLLEKFAEKNEVKIRVRYASTAGIAATVLEEGGNTPADVVYLQDAGALGALAQEEVLVPLDEELLQQVDRRFRSPDGLWLGTSGRARTIIYNVDAINPDTDLPDSILGFTDPEWRGRIGWAPTNGSFQAFVTALRVQLGESEARGWLEGILANDPVIFPNNLTTVRAAAEGEIEVGFVNHYYLHRFLNEKGEDFGARNHYIRGGDPGGMVNVAGVGIISQSDNKPLAEKFVQFLLTSESQNYFANETFEFPLVEGVATETGIPPLSTLDPPHIDLGEISDLKGTLALLRDVGVLK